MYNQSEDKISSSVELQEIVDKITGVIDPAKLEKLKLSTPEKEYIIKDRISQIKVFLHVLPQQGSHIPDISPPPQVCYYYADGTKRQWVSYSPSKDALFSVPCIDAVLRGQHLRPNKELLLLWLVFVRGKSSIVRYCNTKLVPHIGIQ